jgi:hypothetical protein
MRNSLSLPPRSRTLLAVLASGVVVLSIPIATSAAPSTPLLSAHLVQAESVQKAGYYRHHRYWNHRYSHYRRSGWYYG